MTKNFIQGQICKFFYSVIVLSFYVLQLNAEGTQQLRPTYASFGNLTVGNFTIPINFGQFGSQPNGRINIRVNSLNERIYYGFGNIKKGVIFTPGEAFVNSTDIFYRIIDPAGTVILTAQVPTAGQGYIGNHTLAAYNRCVTGPQQVAGNTGYNALKIIPQLVGDYHIEFTTGSANNFSSAYMQMQLFDITVSSSKGQFDADNSDPGNPIGIAIPGRLHSRLWVFDTGGQNNSFTGKTYIYTPDSLISEVDFNGYKPFSIQVAANSYGIANTGNPLNDRKSVVGYNINPEFKVFISPPDTNVFKVRKLSCVADFKRITQCNLDSVEIRFSFTQPVGLQLYLELNGIQGFQPTSEDVMLRNGIMLPGNYVQKWGRKNGLGNTVAPGTSIKLMALTKEREINLPVFDVEDCSNGFKVKSFMPEKNGCGSTLGFAKLMWDDSNLIGGNAIDGLVNLTGAESSNGAHKYNGRGVQPTEETMNTFWFHRDDKDSVTFRLAFLPKQVNAKDTVFLCAGTNQNYTISFPFDSIIWNNNSTSFTRNLVFNVPQYPFVGYRDGCTYFDTIFVRSKNNTVFKNLPDTVSLCALSGTNSFFFPVLNGAPNLTILPPGLSSFTNDSLQLNFNGNRKLYFSSVVQGCLVVDSTYIIYQNTSLGTKIIEAEICEGSTYNLNFQKVNIIEITPSATAQINTLPTQLNILFSPIQNSSYIIRYINNTGCLVKDTVAFTLIEKPEITGISSRNLCIGDTYIANASFRNESGAFVIFQGDTLINQPLSITQNDTATLPLQYLAFNDACLLDTTFLWKFYVKPVTSLNDEYVFCENSRLPQYILPAYFFDETFRYNWNEESTDFAALVEREGLYIITITNECASVVDSTTVVFENCDCAIFMPSAFTPNGDFDNELIRPRFSCDLVNYQFMIYNRFGEVVFQTQNVNDAWDGRIGNELMPIGLYTYRVEYEFNTLERKKQIYKKSGHFLLLK
jgi:gliding motility-associated-like protein